MSLSATIAEEDLKSDSFCVKWGWSVEVEQLVAFGDTSQGSGGGFSLLGDNFVWEVDVFVVLGKKDTLLKLDNGLLQALSGKNL